jgi:hypothetical protein
MSTDMPHMVPIIAGRTCIGFLLSTARGVAAYSREERLLGTFPNAIEAAVAVKKSVVPACPGCSK